MLDTALAKLCAFLENSVPECEFFPEFRPQPLTVPLKTPFCAVSILSAGALKKGLDGFSRTAFSENGLTDFRALDFSLKLKLHVLSPQKEGAKTVHHLFMRIADTLIESATCPIETKNLTAGEIFPDNEKGALRLEITLETSLHAQVQSSSSGRATKIMLERR